MLEFLDVSKYSLKNITLKVNKGEFCVLKGPSGSGKTTFCKLASCNLFPDVGTIRIDGILSNKKNSALIKRKVAFINGNNLPFYDNKTLAQNLSYFLTFIKMYNKDKINSILTKLNLMQKENSFIREFSYTERMKTEIAFAILREPFLLLIDIPFYTFDENDENLLLSLFKNINTIGTTIILTLSKGCLPYKTRELVLMDGKIG